jgi:hypothetical protein
VLPFFLYFAAGAVTGYHVYTLLLLAAYGAPFNPLELVSLLGSLCLFVAAYLSLFRPYAAGRLALIACLAIWCFYGPAIAKIVRTRLGKPAAVSSLNLQADPRTEALKGKLRTLRLELG